MIIIDQNFAQAKILQTLPRCGRKLRLFLGSWLWFCGRIWKSPSEQIWANLIWSINMFWNTGIISCDLWSQIRRFGNRDHFNPHPTSEILGLKVSMPQEKHLDKNKKEFWLHSKEAKHNWTSVNSQSQPGGFMTSQVQNLLCNVSVSNPKLVIW